MSDNRNGNELDTIETDIQQLMMAYPSSSNDQWPMTNDRLGPTTSNYHWPRAQQHNDSIQLFMTLCWQIAASQTPPPSYFHPPTCQKCTLPPLRLTSGVVLLLLYSFPLYLPPECCHLAVDTRTTSSKFVFIEENLKVFFSLIGRSDEGE